MYLLFVLTLFPTVSPLEAREWANPLYFSGGGLWTQRLMLTVSNAGRTEAAGTTADFRIGPDGLPLAGVPLRELRVTSESGREYQFRVTDRGRILDGGVIPEGAILTVPVDVAAGMESRLFVYYGNPYARSLPFYLAGSSCGFSDSLEEGSGDGPELWLSLYTSPEHRNFWSSAVSRSGRRSLQTSVAPGSASSWVSWSRDLAVSPGNAYRLSGWVRGKEVESGKAGFYVHVYGDGKTLVNRVEAPLEGTFDWTRVAFDVKIPEGAQVLRFGTVMTGSGDTWFDDIAIELLTGSRSDTFADGVLPAGWRVRDTSAHHRAVLSDSVGRTDRFSLLTEVDPGSERTWVSHQREIPVVPGSRIRASGWVKGENVREGGAGFFIHANPSGGAFAVNELKASHAGSFDWQKIEFEFTVPENCDHFEIGTVLRATGGKAWFDDVCVEVQRPGLIPSFGEPETLRLNAAAPVAWELPAEEWPSRIPLRCVNTSSRPIRSVLFAVPLQRLTHMNPTDDSIRLVLDGKTVAASRFNGQLLFMLDSVPPHAERRLHLYLRADAENITSDSGIRLVSHSQSDYHLSDGQAVDFGFYERLLNSPANLVQNCSFERGLEEWKRGGESSAGDAVGMSTAVEGMFGDSAARVEIPAGAEPDWFGLRQVLRLEPGRNYLLAGWSRSRAVASPDGMPVFQAESGRIYCHLYDRSSPDVRLMRGTPGNPHEPNREWEFGAVTFRSFFPEPMAEVHLTMKGSGTFEYDGILLTEIRDLLPLPMEHAVDRTREGVAVWQENTIRKVFHDSCRVSVSEPFRVEMARNESEGLQLAFRSCLPLNDLTLTATAPVEESGASLAAPEVGMIGYVPVDSVSEYYRFQLKPWEMPIPDSNTAGMDFPDPILPGSQFDLEPLKTRSAWLGFETTADTRPGLYLGTIELRSGGKLLGSYPYQVLVRDFVLDREGRLPAVFDIRYGSRRDLKGYSLEELLRFMAQKKICPDRVPVEPRFTLEDGRVAADFTEYDRMAELYFDELKFPFSYYPSFFSGFGWANVPDAKFNIRAFDGGPLYENTDRSRLRPEYKAVYQQALRLFLNHIREKGWADRMTVFIADEPYWEMSAQLGALCDMIHEVSPEIRIYSSTWWYKSELDGRLDYWGAGIHGSIPPEILEEIRAKAGKFYFTMDGHFCLDTEYNAAERMLPLFCYKYGAELYEFWGADWFTRNPFEWGQHDVTLEHSAPGISEWIRYPNGDGYLLYPGKPAGAGRKILSSIRLEAVRDGVEDFDYYRQLARLVEKSGDRKGAEILAELKTLIAMPNLGGRNSAGILPDPDRFTELRSAAAEAIVRLQR